MKINFKRLIISILIPIGVGGLSGFLTKDSMQTFEELNKHALSPPGIVFPIVWGILFLLMGISFYLIWQADLPSADKRNAYIFFAAQLVVNFFWSIIFFNLQNYVFAFNWLLLLWVLIIAMIVSFSRISKPAAYLQIPYLLWVTFAGYLNFMIILLNK